MPQRLSYFKDNIIIPSRFIYTTNWSVAIINSFANLEDYLH